MSHSEFELVVAPRLEQDVLEYYQTIRFAPIPESINYEDHKKNIDQEFKRKLSGYFSGWRRMMMACMQEHLYFSFWADKFFQAYCSVLREENINFFEITELSPVSFYTDKLVKRLRILFGSTSLSEEMHKQNEQYDKRIEKLRESYRNTSQIYPDAVDLKLELSLNDVGNEITDIRQLDRYFTNFQKRLAAEIWFRTQVVYRFYRFIRDDLQQRYVIQFYLTFNPSLYSFPLVYCHDIRKLWLMATGNLGICDCPRADHQHASLNTEPALRIDKIVQEEEQCPLGALNDMPENQTGLNGLAGRICIHPKTFKWFDGAPVRR